MFDGYGRQIKYARISATDRCNLRCLYCMGKGGIDKLSHSDILTYEEIEKIVSALSSLGIEKIRLTGESRSREEGS